MSECDWPLYGSEKLELGPAYQAWESGQSDISLEWKSDMDVGWPFLPEWCTAQSPKFQSRSVAIAYSTLWVAYAVCLIFVVAVYIRAGDLQPLRFRNTAASYCHLVFQTLLYSFAVFGCATGLTRPIWLDMATTYVLCTVFGVYYLIRPLQYIVMVKLSTLKGDERKGWERFKWIMSSAFYFKRVTVVEVATVFIVFAAMASDYALVGHNVASIVRCSWWQIPDKYVTANNPQDPICQCVYATQPAIYSSNSSSHILACVKASSGYPPFLSTSICNDPSDKYSVFCSACGNYISHPSECTTCFQNVNLSSECSGCLYGESNTCPGECWRESDQTDSCHKCTSTLVSHSCEWFLRRFFLESGECGFVKQAPAAYSCTFGTGSDSSSQQTTAYATFALFPAIYLTITALLLQVGAKDNIFVFQEALVSALLTVAGIGFSVLVEFSIDARYAMAKNFYLHNQPNEMQLVFQIWGYFALSFVIPAVRSLGASGSKTRKLQPEASLATDAIQDRLRFACCNETHKGIFESFCAAEFTIENFNFLAESFTLIDLATSLSSYDLCQSFGECYNNYLSADAPFEVNISSNTRERARKECGVVMEMMENLKTRSTEASLQMEDGQRKAIVESIRAAQAEILQMVKRDSWPRFESSKRYQLFARAYESNLKVERILTAISDTNTRTRDEVLPFEYQRVP